MSKNRRDGKKSKSMWILFGVLIVAVMATASLAMGETPASPDKETPVQSTSSGEQSSPLAANSANQEVTVGGFILTGENLTENIDYSYASSRLTILSSKAITIRNKDEGETTDYIQIQLNSSEQAAGAHLTLDGVNIKGGGGTGGRALSIEDNATYNVNIVLAEGSQNFLMGDFAAAGLQKNGDPNTTPNLGTLTIDGTGSLTATGGSGRAAGIGGDGGTSAGGYTGSNIVINGGKVTAIGGSYGGAGIGSGTKGIGKNITINGGTVNATGGYRAAGIGGGTDGGSGSNNKLNGNAVALATSGNTSTDALQGFTYTKGIAFTKKGSNSWAGMMYGNSTAVTADATFPAALTVASGKTLTVNPNVTLGLDALLTIDGTLQNEGTTDSTKISCGATGKVTTKVSYIEDVGNSMASINPKVITYQENGGAVKTYTSGDLPTPDPKEGYTFQNWCSDSGRTQNITEGALVELNTHTFYAKWEAASEYTIDVQQPTGGTIAIQSKAQAGETVVFKAIPESGYQIQGLPQVNTTNETANGSIPVTPTGNANEYQFTMPASEVNITAEFARAPQPGPTPTPTPGPGSGGNGSSGSAKTGDPFAGGIALALLGTAAVAGIALKKRK